MSKQTFTTGQVLTAAEMTTLQANDYNQTVSAKVASYVLVAADAGTRITMSNAGATTVTVNTALFAAGDTLIITNIGVGVTTITAGTATVSTGGSLALNQYDSGTLYFTSTGVAIWNGANPGDITAVVAGNGLSGGASSGSATLAIDTAITVDKTTAQTLTNKTLTSPALTTPTISTLTTNGDTLYGTGSGAISRLGIGSTSQVLTVAGGVPTWATPTTGSTFSGARVTKSANQSVAATTYTSVTWNQEPLDVGGYHDNATNNTRLTIPTGKTGYFLVQWNLHSYNIGAMAYRLLKNGSSIVEWSDSYNWAAGVEIDFTNQWLGALSAGDYIEIQVWMSTAKSVYGSSTATYEPSWFQITYLGA